MRPRSARFQVPLAVNIDQGVDNRATLPTAPTIGHGSTHDVLHLDHHHRTVTARTSHCFLSMDADHPFPCQMVRCITNHSSRTT